MIPLIEIAISCLTSSEKNWASEFVQFYAASLRGPLFTGFLTLTGFLFSMKTFIVVNMKKEVYDSKSYKKRFDEMRQVNDKLKLYGPLERLSKLLLFTVSLSLTTSCLQFTLGLVPSIITVSICLLSAVVTICSLGFSLWEIRGNLKRMFDLLEEDSND